MRISGFEGFGLEDRVEGLGLEGFRMFGFSLGLLASGDLEVACFLAFGLTGFWAFGALAGL